MSMSGGCLCPTGWVHQKGDGYTRGGMVCQRENGIPEGEWYTRGGMVYRWEGIPVGGYTGGGQVYQRVGGGQVYQRHRTGDLGNPPPCTDT